ncbi:MAG: GntR family transcriptional regulator [Spirochaetales bacterium]|nr:MAG: GntR family transcriptional regulator [Spirochaetales bacterium]
MESGIIMKTSSNKKVKVYENLKRRIIDCDLVPGMPINEADFAAELGVSKTPIREALRQLERDGFVHNVPGRGSTISHITSQDIREILEIREIIETGAAKHAAQFQSQNNALIKKRSEHQYLLDDKSEGNEYVHEWGEWEDVHLCLVQALGNQMFLIMYEDLLDRIKRIRNHFGRRFTQRRRHEIISEHLMILDAVLDGDPDRAEQAVRKHLQNAGSYLQGLSVARKE